MTDDEILALAEKHGYWVTVGEVAHGVPLLRLTMTDPVAFARALLAREREEAAKVCDERASDHRKCSESALFAGPLAGTVRACMIEAQGCAAAIRSRT